MLQLHARLQSNSYPNCRKMAEVLEVSYKTIQRDLDFMRDRLGLPIAYDQLKIGFYYTEPVQGFPSIEVSEGELVALFVAQKALQLYQGTAFAQQLGAAFRKITDSLQDRISFRWTDVDDSISFHSVGTTEPDVQIFREVSSAVRQSRELLFEYRKVGGKGHERRRIQPYHLGCVKNQWYAIGFDPEREAMRTFALPRMRRAKASETTFVRPEDFSIAEHLGPGLGVMRGDGTTYRVHLRFDDFAGRMIAERRWHHSQKVTERPDGGVDLQLELGSLEEIKRWCLSWGTHLQVLAPPELIESVRKVAAAVAQQYRAR